MRRRSLPSAPWTARCSWPTRPAQTASGRPFCTWCWTCWGGRVCLGWPAPVEDWPPLWRTAGSRPALLPAAGWESSASLRMQKGRLGFAWGLSGAGLMSSMMMAGCSCKGMACVQTGGPGTSRQPCRSCREFLPCPGGIQGRRGGRVRGRATTETGRHCPSLQHSPEASARVTDRDRRGSWADDQHRRKCERSLGEGHLELWAVACGHFQPSSGAQRLCGGTLFAVSSACTEGQIYSCHLSYDLLLLLLTVTDFHQNTCWFLRPLIQSWDLFSPYLLSSCRLPGTFGSGRKDNVSSAKGSWCSSVVLHRCNSCCSAPNAWRSPEEWHQHQQLPCMTPHECSQMDFSNPSPCSFRRWAAHSDILTPCPRRQDSSPLSRVCCLDLPLTPELQQMNGDGWELDFNEPYVALIHAIVLWEDVTNGKDWIWLVLSLSYLLSIYCNSIRE